MNLDALRSSIDFEPEEPGTLVVLVLAAAFLVFAPKSGCSFHAEEPAAEEPSADAQDVGVEAAEAEAGEAE